MYNPIKIYAHTSLDDVLLLWYTNWILVLKQLSSCRAHRCIYNKYTLDDVLTSVQMVSFCCAKCITSNLFCIVLFPYLKNCHKYSKISVFFQQNVLTWAIPLENRWCHDLTVIVTASLPIALHHYQHRTLWHPYPSYPLLLHQTPAFHVFLHCYYKFDLNVKTNKTFRSQILIFLNFHACINFSFLVGILTE